MSRSLVDVQSVVSCRNRGLFVTSILDNPAVPASSPPSATSISRSLVSTDVLDLATHRRPFLEDH